MSLNGAGVYSPNTAGQPVVTGTTIDATVFNALVNDIASALSTAVYKDGQQTVTANIPMATYKFTGLGSGTDATDSARIDNCNVLNMCEGRLTLTTGTPVTTADVTAAETLYFAPYRGNRIALYDGSKWVMRTFTQLSIDVPDVTGVHDVFAYDAAGTVTLEVLVWTNDTTRATALTTQDGVLCKTGALTRRYLGTFYSTTAGNGQIEDSVSGRYLWNYYNRVPRFLYAGDATNSWAYTTATIRQANNSALNQLNFVVGYDDAPVDASVRAHFSNNNAATVLVASGIGLDSTSGFATNCSPSASGSIPGSAALVANQSAFRGYSGVGKHYLAWLEYSEATGTTTWYGDNGTTVLQSAIRGYLLG